MYSQLFHMMYTVVLVQDDGHGAVGVASQDFSTLEEARAFAQEQLPAFKSDDDQVFIEFQGPSDFVPQEIERIK